MNIADAAWMAGLFEGEGCMTIRPSKNYCQLQLKMTDEDVVMRFAALAGVPQTFYIERPSPLKDAWLWQTGKREHVERLLTAMLPFFGERRSTKAKQLLQFYNDRDNRNSEAAAITVGQLSQLGDQH